MTTPQVPDFPAYFVDLLLDAVFLVDARGRVTYVNAACERIFGYTPAELIGESMINYVVPEDREKTLIEAQLVMAGHPRVGFQNRYLRKDGEHVHIMWSARWSEADQLRIGVARDITAKKRAEEFQTATYAISEAVHNATDLTALFQEISHIIKNLVSLAGVAVTTYDADTRQLDVAYEQNFPMQSSELKDLLLNSSFAEIIRNGCPTRLCRDTGPTLSAQAHALHPDHNYLVMPLVTQTKAIGALVLASRKNYSNKDQELLYFVSSQIATAIERKQLLEELAYSARYDDLTTLPNRRLLYDRMESAFARARRKQSRNALLFIDIDGFKQVNDTLGHATGDILLKHVALRLKQSLREDDTVARLGGDEFVVLLEEIHTAQDAHLVADKLRSAIAQPLRIHTIDLQVIISIGTAIYPDHGTEPAQLLKHADDIMYQIKKNKVAGTSWSS